MTIHAAIYARASHDFPLSTNEQIECLTKIAAERGCTVVHVFTDRPTTLKNGRDRRPGELALINAIQSQSAKQVLIWSVCRIGKSLVELIRFLETCRLAGTSVWVEEQKLDTTASNGMSLFEVTAMMAVHLRQSRRDRILRGQAAARSLDQVWPTTAHQAEGGDLAAGKGVREIARLAGISPASVSRIKNSMSTEVASI